MKKLFSALVLALSLSVAPLASAAVQEFGPDFGRFTVDVPAGWTTQNIDGGVVVVNAAKDTSVAIACAKNNGESAKDIASAVAQQSGFVNPTIERGDDDSTYVVSGQINGQDTNTVIVTEDDLLFVISIAGKDMDAASAIVDTLEGK